MVRNVIKVKIEKLKKSEKGKEREKVYREVR
jgi:hypothetical protein